ncbi:hypothetical protein AB0F92_26375 [Kitasatospora aureofaciens]|uniref:Uncharacterized protein n=1 Tax=Kitasatospora aureofaciens TaxID=1894 RepID=A0A1E7NFD9_KITAU|nr:hypothetical protein [Kitasatospora aureofaciens]OEV39419.1 hypothetical protein HS99_0001590 [Kitasatospora aureofaciens]QEV03332.1 hypothetical protein CP971_32600 [Streptomyces viridifaciens]UKZ10021.1 hypothetical protein BOQ63_039600 [Streptomyces viridifaciens]
MNEELAELAASGATALVAAMGTDLWTEAKRLMSGVVARAHGGRRRELSAALELPSTTTRGVVDGEAVSYWTDALVQLLHRNPGLAQDVMALASLRIPRQPDVAVQVNSATGSGEVFAVQHGNQHFAGGPRSRDSGDGR